MQVTGALLGLGSKTKALYISGNWTSQPKLKKQKTPPPKKTFLHKNLEKLEFCYILGNVNIKNKLLELCYILGNGSIKKFSYIFSKESFSYISGNRNPKKILYISGGTSKAPKTKISYISPKEAMNKFF